MSAALPIATNLYFDNHFGRRGVKLLPNEFYTTREDMVLVTVLGSCVAACIHDRTAGIGGMNHFMLPDDGEQPSQAASDAMRYGAYAMEVLINELIKMGGRRERFEAKVFGGAAVLAGMTTINIGDRNAEFVRRYLGLEKIRIVAEDLQGVHPRKVAFMPDTGQAMVKKLRLQQDPTVAEREQALAKQVAEARAARHARAARERGRVELFSTNGSGQAGQTALASQTGPAGQTAAQKPRIEVFGAPAAKPRIELFGSSARGASPINSAKTVEEA